MQSQIFDPYDARVHADPYPVYHLVRDEYPVYFNEHHGFWALSRFADVQTATRDWKTFANGGGVDLDGGGDLCGSGNIVGTDPPVHDVLRDVVRHHFALRAVGRLEAEIRGRATMLLEAFIERGRADLARELASPLPFAVTADLIGVPGADLGGLEQLLEQFCTRDPGVAETPPSAVRAAAELRRYFADLANERVRCQRDDMISVMVDAAEAGRITREDVAGLGFSLLFAGYEAPRSLITNTLVLLAAYPEARSTLTRNSELIPNAIEESLRFDAPVQHLTRTTTRDVYLHGQAIPAGARVLLLFGSANRDERRFDDPDIFDIRRASRRHLAFGEGIHHCLGASLARLEAKIVVEEVLSSMPDYEIVGTPERIWHLAGDRGFKSVPTMFEPWVAAGRA